MLPIVTCFDIKFRETAEGIKQAQLGDATVADGWAGARQFYSNTMPQYFELTPLKKNDFIELLRLSFSVDTLQSAHS